MYRIIYICLCSLIFSFPLVAYDWDDDWSAVDYILERFEWAQQHQDAYCETNPDSWLCPRVFKEVTNH